MVQPRYIHDQYDEDEDQQDEDESEDEFEDDDFVVDDTHQDAYEEEEYDHDNEEEEEEHDDCCLCGDGGELIICDGGDAMEGCGKSFHTLCIGRQTVPEGDWICQTCASTIDIVVGIQGHEFPDSAVPIQTRLV
jgi:RecJ-like exonuclease